MMGAIVGVIVGVIVRPTITIEGPRITLEGPREDGRQGDSSCALSKDEAGRNPRPRGHKSRSILDEINLKKTQILDCVSAPPSMLR